MRIHCLYCGSEREEDQCPSCGLTSAAAEVMLRRRLVWRTAWFLVGAVLFVPVCEAFPPLELDKILIFVGGLFFLVLGLGFWMVERARRHQEIEVIKEDLLWFSAGAVDSDGPAVRERQIRCAAADLADDRGGGEIRHAGLVADATAGGHVVARRSSG